MSFGHNSLKNLQGGTSSKTPSTYVNEFYHLTAAELAAAQTLGTTGVKSGEFSVSLGVSSIVENAACLAASKIFLMPQDSAAAGLATAIGYSVAAGVGSFTATHGSAVSTAGKFSYLFV